MSADQLNLLDCPESLSPRLKWMRERNVSTGENLNLHLPWEAWIGEYPDSSEDVIHACAANRLSCGETEELALYALAECNGWSLWNDFRDISTPALETLPAHAVTPCPVCKLMVKTSGDGARIGVHRRQSHVCKGTGRAINE